MKCEVCEQHLAVVVVNGTLHCGTCAVAAMDPIVVNAERERAKRERAERNRKALAHLRAQAVVSQGQSA